MFKSKEKSNTGGSAADSISMIAAGMKIVGDVESENDMRIDGHIEGNIYCKSKVVLGQSGKIDGDLQAANADIFGTVNGHVLTRDLLCLKSKCTINGDIKVGRLDIQQDAEFNGSCTMMHEQTTPKLLTEKSPVLQEEVI